MVFERHRHRWKFDAGCHQLNFQTGIEGRLVGARSEHRNVCFDLFEVRKVLIQRLNPRRAKENQHLVFLDVHFAQVVAHGSVENGAGVFDLGFVEQLGDVGFLNV